MSDDSPIHTVRSHEDLCVNPPSPTERETIAQLLSEGAPGVVWIPEWLVDDKDVAVVENYYRLAVGEVERYSDEAFRLTQPDGSEEFLPISQVEAFALAEDVDTVTTPQSGLSDY